MNSLNLSLFDSVVPFASDFPAAHTDTTPRVHATTRPAAAPLPSSLWQQSLAAHEPTTRARWGVRACYSVLGLMFAVSLAYAAMQLFPCVLDQQHGLHAAVQTLMAR